MQNISKNYDSGVKVALGYCDFVCVFVCMWTMKANDSDLQVNDRLMLV